MTIQTLEMPLWIDLPEVLAAAEAAKLAEDSGEDPFALGWRDINYISSSGEVTYARLPLTMHDILHPEPGDFRVHNTDHEHICNHAYNVCSLRVHPDPHAVVYHDVRIAWDRPNIEPHTPDISVIFNVKEANRTRSTFYEIEEGTKPTLVIEVTSPGTRKLDLVTKYEQYALVGLQYYIIIDTDFEADLTERRILGYELKRGRYQDMPRNQQGWIWLPPVGVWLGIEEGEPQFYDDTGQVFRNYSQVYIGSKLAEEQAEIEAQARATAEAQAQAATEAQAAAEAQAQAATEAQAAAEAQVRAATEAQAAAEAQVMAEAQARLDAEKQAATEAQARAALEAQLQEMAAELQGLRNKG